MTLSPHRVALAITAVFLLVGLLRINDLSLYTDSTRYLIWGNSLAHLEGYVDNTQPVPDRFVMNAPLYPLLLVPVELFFPLSVTAAKIWTLAWGALALFLFSIWLQRHLKPMVAVACLLFLALNPLYITISTEILSEAPFLVLTMLLFISFERYIENPEEKQNRRMLFVCLAVAALLREVGAAYVLTSLVIIFQMKRGRDLVLVSFSAGLLFLLWTLRNSMLVTPTEEQAANIQYMFRHFVTATDASFLAELATRFWLNLKGYIWNVGGSILYPFPDRLIALPSAPLAFIQAIIQQGHRFLLPFLLLTGGLGAVKDLKSSLSGRWRFLSAACYIMIILLYPVNDIRFVLPLLPLIFFYLFQGTFSLGKALAPPARRALGVVLILLVLVPNGLAIAEILKSNVAYKSSPERFSDEGGPAYFGHPWSLLGEWIRDHVPEQVVIASPAKEIAAFVGRRKVVETSRVLPTPVFERVIRDHNTEFLVTIDIWDTFETFQFAMAESKRLWFEPMVSAGRLHLYKVHSVLLDPPSTRKVQVNDTSTATGLLLEGRKALLQQRYRNAANLLERALAIRPAQPEIAFQFLSVLALLSDSVRAVEIYQRLFTIPQSTAYTQLARAHLTAMEQHRNARRQRGKTQQAFAAFEVGLAYWGLGYSQAALTVMRNVVRVDTTNFVGALWGTHMSKQLGDSTESNHFLDRLKKIDASAQIVGDWERIRQHEESLKKARSPKERVHLHLQIANIYGKIELFDEALDATERARTIDPNNVDVWLYVAELYEKKHAPVGTKRAYENVLALEPHNSFAKAKLDSLSI